MPEIDILMAVRNGEKYIAEQIDSILNQTFQDFRLIIRDNASSDNTPAIIEEYVKKYPGKVQAVHDDVDCTAIFTKNFMQLLTYAEADYVMFTDADDVWLPYKVQVTLWHMKELERKNPGLPALVFCGLKVVDENLETMNMYIQYSLEAATYKLFTNMILANQVSGCALLMNKALYSKCKGYVEGMPFFHDNFFGTLAALCGVIEHIPAAMMLYRQHKHNATGYFGVGGNSGRFVNLLKKIPTIRQSLVSVKERCKFLHEHYADVIPPEKLEELERFQSLLNRNKLVKIFTALFGNIFHIERNMSIRIRYFAKFVLC